MPFLTVGTTATQELDILQICLRLLCAMIVGLVIGTEREYTHRPAGMRTHILVALGACAVTITSEMIFFQYNAMGATPDPARLSAQVIAGVGFLGAGTIMREGTNVKGLTTAASLWTVAGLGIAAGYGYYTVAIAGMVFIFVTLTLFEVFQNKLIRLQGGKHIYCMETTDIAEGLQALNTHCKASHIEIRDVMVHRLSEESYRVTFQAVLVRNKKRQARFFEKLLSEPSVTSLGEIRDPANAGIK